MRDPKRIKRILEMIEECWNKYPDQRFTQLLINLGLMEDGTKWHYEDDELEEGLKEYISKSKEE